MMMIPESEPTAEEGWLRTAIQSQKNLRAAHSRLRNVRSYLDELTEIAATFGPSASQDIATIVKGLAEALGEEQ